MGQPNQTPEQLLKYYDNQTKRCLSIWTALEDNYADQTQIEEAKTLVRMNNCLIDLYRTVMRRNSYDKSS